ncbi:MAG: hypothetical protein ACRDDX_00855, partial [Cellulosilyticaceae bacterium]
ITTVDAEKIQKVKGVDKVKIDGNSLSVVSRKEVTNLHQILADLVATNTQITSVQTKKLDLEDVFLNLTGRNLRD